MRSGLLDEFGADYVRTAKAKGVNDIMVVLRHVLKNALIPIITVSGFQLGNLMGGVVFTETVFARLRPYVNSSDRGSRLSSRSGCAYRSWRRHCHDQLACGFIVRVHRSEIASWTRSVKGTVPDALEPSS